MTRPSDLNGIFDAISRSETSMFWIEDTPIRSDGFIWFQRHPERILAWLDKYMQ